MRDRDDYYADYDMPDAFVERMAQKEQEAEKAVLQEPEKTAEPREVQMGDGREPGNSL